MRTARLLPVSPSIHYGGVCSGRCLLLWGVCSQGGVCSKGGVCSGGCLLWGVSALGGVCSGGCLLWGVSALGVVAPGGCLLPGGVWSKGGVCSQGVCIPACNGADTPRGQTDTCENITFANFVCGR